MKKMQHAKPIWQPVFHKNPSVNSHLYLQFADNHYKKNTVKCGN